MCLINMEEDVNVSNGYNQTPLHYAVEELCKGIVECELCKNIIRLLIENNANIAAFNRKQKSPVSLTLQEEREGMIHLFNKELRTKANIKKRKCSSVLNTEMFHIETKRLCTSVPLSQYIKLITINTYLTERLSSF